MIMISDLTVWFVVLCVVWILFWQLSVIAIRRRDKISFGDGGNRLLLKRSRVHMNSVETLMPFGLLLVVVDLSTDALLVAWIAVGMMIVGRALHPFGVLDGRRFLILRMIGMQLTILSTVVLAGFAVWVLLG